MDKHGDDDTGIGRQSSSVFKENINIVGERERRFTVAMKTDNIALSFGRACTIWSNELKLYELLKMSAEKFALR